MVVTRKQKDNRLHKKSSSSPLAEYRHASLNVNEKEPLGNRRFQKEVNGPGVTSRNRGKWKAQDESGLKSPTKDNKAATKSVGVEQLGLGKGSNQTVGCLINSLSRAKSNSNFVRGKKDLARYRAISTNSASASKNSDSAIFSKEKINTTTEWSLNISKLQPGFDGEFKFGSSSGHKMGDQCRRSDSGDTECYHRGDQSSPHSHHGLVQSQALKGMEVGISANSDKLNDGLSPLKRPGLGKND